MFFAKGRSSANPGSLNVVEIAVESITLNPHQPRQAFDEGRLGELVSSIRRHGILQPLIVRPVGNAYELVVGESCLRAARLAGLRKVPAVVREIEPEEMAVLALLESLQREDLNVIEEAKGYQRLLEEFELTQSEIGRLVGKGQSTIANKLRLLHLPEAVQARIVAGGVSERHARALLELTDEAAQSRMLDEIVGRKLSVRETEERVRELMSGLGTLTAGRPTRRGGGKAGQTGLFNHLAASRGTREGSPSRPSERGTPIRQLGQVNDRRAIRAFRDVRLFLNTFRRAVEMLKEAGVRAEMSEVDGPDFLEVKVIIPKAGPPGPGSAGPGRVRSKASPEGRG